MRGFDSFSVSGFFNPNLCPEFREGVCIYLRFRDLKIVLTNSNEDYAPALFTTTGISQIHFMVRNIVLLFFSLFGCFWKWVRGGVYFSPN